MSEAFTTFFLLNRALFLAHLCKVEYNRLIKCINARAYSM